MIHIASREQFEGRTIDWYEQVGDEQNADTYCETGPLEFLELKLEGLPRARPTPAVFGSWP
jgi:hypothetical protein